MKKLKNHKSSTGRILLAGLSITMLMASTMANAGSVGNSHGWMGNAFGSTQGWTTKNHPRVMADMNGDGLTDIVGFANKGVYVSLSTGSRFLSMKKWSGGFTLRDGGWKGGKNPRYVVDVDNNGCADIVGFANQVVRIVTSHDTNGDGFCNVGGAKLKPLYEGFGALVDITAPRFVADIDGDSCQDLVYFGRTKVDFALGHCDGTFSATGTSLLSFRKSSTVSGELKWDFAKHKVMLGDIDGDGDADIIGFHDLGVYVSYSNGDGTYEPLIPNAEPVLAEFGYGSGWRLGANPRQLVDMNNDGLLDIIGFANQMTRVAYANGNGFDDYVVVSNGFGTRKGWDANTVRATAHINNDGCLDVVGMGKGGVYAALSNATSYGVCDGISYANPLLLVDYYSKSRGGWNNTAHVRYFTDLNGDGLDDVIGLSSTNPRVSLNMEVTTKQYSAADEYTEVNVRRVMY